METASAIAGKEVSLLQQEALALLNRGDTAAAEANLSRLMANAAPSADTLQLMGLLRRMQGRNEEAEDFYRRSLVLDPGQPNVHHNLGNLLKSLGRYDEAIAEQREAIRLKPNYAEAHLNLGLALAAAGDHAAAEKSCRDALRLQPNYLLAKQSLAAELNELRRPKEAEQILRQTLALGARDERQIAALEHNLGLSLKMQRRYAEALRFFDSAQVRVPDMPAADYNRGNTLQQLGRHAEAIGSYRRAIARNPLDMVAHRDLNQLLYRLGDDNAFLKSYDEVAALYPDEGALPMQKGDFLFLKGNDTAAREAFERAARLLPKSVMPHDGLALIFARSGQFDDAVREHEIAVGMEPQNAHAWRNYAETLLRAGDAKGALSAAEKSLAIQPLNQSTLAIWGIALRLAGDPLEERINDYTELVRVYDIAPPDGYADIDSFNRDLNLYLDRLHGDTREAIDQTLRNGTQTFDNLIGTGHAPVELLRARIDTAIADYIAHLAEDADHPLLKRKNAQFEYAASWSARLHDCGFHTNHVHSKGWISSAYYVAVPDAVESAAAKEGWLKFGEPNFDCGLKDPIRRAVQPRSGLLVLFPSYMWHGTVPFRSQQARTTIAFDVTPQGR